MDEKPIGEISHYFGKIGVAVIKLDDTLKVNEKVHIKGANTDFTQDITSMQIDHNPVEEAKAGQSIGMKVDQPVREHDKVYRA